MHLSLLFSASLTRFTATILTLPRILRLPWRKDIACFVYVISELLVTGKVWKPRCVQLGIKPAHRPLCQSEFSLKSDCLQILAVPAAKPFQSHLTCHRVWLMQGLIYWWFWADCQAAGKSRFGYVFRGPLAVVLLKCFPKRHGPADEYFALLQSPMDTTLQFMSHIQRWQS